MYHVNNHHAHTDGYHDKFFNLSNDHNNKNEHENKQHHIYIFENKNNYLRNEYFEAAESL